jgi:hypothetical protein
MPSYRSTSDVNQPTEETFVRCCMPLLTPGFQRFAFSQIGYFGDVTGVTEINTKV